MPMQYHLCPCIVSFNQCSFRVVPDRVLTISYRHALTGETEATKPLLDKSTLSNGKFIYIGSSGGSLADAPKFGAMPPAAYFASKCAGHYIVRALAAQDDKLCICVICPGLVSSPFEID